MRFIVLGGRAGLRVSHGRRFILYHFATCAAENGSLNQLVSMTAVLRYDPKTDFVAV